MGDNGKGEEGKRGKELKGRSFKLREGCHLVLGGMDTPVSRMVALKVSENMRYKRM